MNVPTAETRTFEFLFPELDTQVQVEVTGNRALIRATRDSFSPRRKELFIRELAAEGFIPDACRWFPVGGPAYGLGVRWVIDVTWNRPPKPGRSRRLLPRLAAGAAVVLAAVLFVMSVLSLARRLPPGAPVIGRLPPGAPARLVRPLAYGEPPARRAASFGPSGLPRPVQASQPGPAS